MSGKPKQPNPKRTTNPDIVAASGKKDFFSVFIGCIFFVWLSQTLAINGKQFAIIVMGLILVISTRFFPDGIILMLKNKLIKKVKWLQS